MPRYRMDGEGPVIECCGARYELQDSSNCCDECGEMFDWMDVLQHWNVEDYMDLLDADLIQELGIDLALMGINPADWENDWENDTDDDDGDIPGWAYSDNYDGTGRQLDLIEVFKKRRLSWQEDLDSYLGLLFDNKKNISRPSWMDGASLSPGTAAKPPTAHLREHHRPRCRKDPFLDVEIPNEVL